MEYNDYPLPNEQLITVLNREYLKLNKAKTAEVNVAVLEQKGRLNELAVYLLLQQKQLKQLNKVNKNIKTTINTANHLKILESMGIASIDVLEEGNLKSCFIDFLKTEGEILKILMFLLLVKNLNYNRCQLEKIMFEQINMFNEVVNF